MTSTTPQDDQTVPSDLDEAQDTPSTSVTEAPGRDMNDGSDDAEDTQIKRPVFIDRVVAASGAKKKDAKPVIEATLAALGDALTAGEELNLPPLGKIRVQRSNTTTGAEVLTLKLRRPHNMTGNTSGADLEETVENADETTLEDAVKKTGGGHGSVDA